MQHDLQSFHAPGLAVGATFGLPAVALTGAGASIG
jgi:hypothetical protein